MKSLSANWFIEGSIDFEHKKYILLSYLQKINQSFHSNELYPELNDLVFHYNNLLKFKKNKSILEQAFPQRLTRADLEAVRLTFEKMVNDDALMQEIEYIISFALSKLDPALQEGKEIYEFVESHLNIESVGMVPLLPYKGYMLLHNGDERGIQVYEYQVTIFESEQEKHRGITTTYLSHYRQSLMFTPENIRRDLVSTRRNILPNPAVYHIESDITFPLQQTLLPLAKLSLIKMISKAA